MFFALWPQSSLQLTLAETTRDALPAKGARAVPTENFHVTLAFLGSVPERRMQDLGSVARRVAGLFSAGAASLLLTFDRMEYWKKAQVLCVLAETQSSQVLALADALTAEATAAGFKPDPKPFRPHVTVARKVAARPIRMPKIQPAQWSFDRFALVESKTAPAGSVYAILETFPLGNLRV
jgi:2'-5' RNA ligase